MMDFLDNPPNVAPRELVTGVFVVGKCPFLDFSPAVKGNVCVILYTNVIVLAVVWYNEIKIKSNVNLNPKSMNQIRYNIHVGFAGRSRK